MTSAWTINVGGRTYGPYSGERMRAFAGEGRLVPASLVARDGMLDWHEARTEPEFAELFNGEAVHAAVRSSPSPQPSPNEPAAPVSSEPKLAQFIIIVEHKSRAPGNFESAIVSLGSAYNLLPNVWIVSTDLSINGVRNKLVQELGKFDSLFVADAARGKAAWFNFGPEADSRIRRVWQKAS